MEFRFHLLVGMEKWCLTNVPCNFLMRFIFLLIFFLKIKNHFKRSQPIFDMKIDDTHENYQHRKCENGEL